ncbi:MAG TPA: substrate-binding domain-containing protein [Flavisolibacter sp.]
MRSAGYTFAIIAGLLMSGCETKTESTQSTFDRGVIHVSCDESFRPVIDAQVEVYEASFPETRIKVHYKPEAECLRDFLVDSITMIIATRGFSENERQAIVDSLLVGPQKLTIAYDAIAVIVHPESPDSLFRMSDIRNMLTSEVLTKKKNKGAGTKKAIIPVLDGGRATSTVRFMIDSVLQGASLGSHVVAAKNSEGVIDYVSRTPNAVGFIGVSWVGNHEDPAQRSFLQKVRIARIEARDSADAFVQPVQYLIYTKSYPMLRDLVYVLKERHRGLGHAFANFLKGERGQLIFKRAYLMPALRPFYVRQAELQEEY